MCVLQGTSVNISCVYSSASIIKEKYWYAWSNNKEPTDLRDDPEYKGRVEYSTERSTLKISDLRETEDSAEYRFKYKSKGKNEWRSTLNGTTLTVTGTTDL